MDVWIDGWVDGGWVDRWVGGCMRGWVGGWMVGDDEGEMCGTGLNYKLCFVCLRRSLMIMICYHVTE